MPETARSSWCEPATVDAVETCGVAMRGSPGARTRDLRIKSPLLYQLS